LLFRKRIAVVALLVAGAIAALWSGRAPLRAADPVPVACPNGQTVFLEGPAPPSAALLLMLKERAVGGGVADRNGFYRIPLRANERPGVYPVEVRLRGSRAVVGRFTCFVDVPLDSAPQTPTSPVPAATRVTRVPPSTSTAPSGTTPVPVAPTPTAIRLTTPVPERTVAPSPTATVVGSPVATATVGPTTTAGVTATAGPTATLTVTPIPNANSVRIMRVALRAPSSSNEEYVEIRNTTTRAIRMTAWRLVNVNRNDVTPYVFPEFVIGPAETINVYSAIDEDDPEAGEFYWRRTDVWRAGDRAELRDAADRLISFLVVGSS